MLDSIKEFRIIASVYRTLSLTVSSEDFNVSPATMSKKLSAIEGKIGKKLFYRSTREFSPTEDGDIFYRYAIEVLDKIDIFANKNELNRELAGLIKLTASATFSRLYLQPVITKFLARYPKVKIDLILSDQVTDIIKEGIDIAIRVAPLKDSSLISRKIGNGNKVLCASPEYLKKNGVPRTPSELKHHNCITLGNDNNWTFIKGRKEYAVKVRGNFQANLGEMLFQSVESGLGISFLSLWFVHKQINQGTIVTLLDDYEIKNQAEIYLMYPDKNQLPRKTRAFIDFIAKELKLPFNSQKRFHNNSIMEG